MPSDSMAWPANFTLDLPEARVKIPKGGRYRTANGLIDCGPVHLNEPSADEPVVVDVAREDT